MKYIKWLGNLSFGSVKGPKKAKSRKSFIFVIDSYLKGSAFTAVKRDAKFSTRYVKGVQFVHRRYTKGVPF